MKEITGCAICAEKNLRHIDAYGKVSREEYDKLADIARTHKPIGPHNFWQTEAYLLDGGDGVVIGRIETFCNGCKDKKVYEGPVVEVIDTP